MTPTAEITAPGSKTYDRLLLFTMLLLVAFGALMIYSATSVLTPQLEQKKITEFYYFKRHLFTMMLGGIAMMFTYRLNPALLKKAATPLLVFSAVLLVLVFVPKIGVTAGGARRWIRLWPTTFQPSELVKLAMVIYLAKYMSTPGYNTQQLSSFVKPLIVMALFQAVFLKQPDFGSTMSLAFLTFALLFISGMRLSYIVSVFLLALPLVYKLVMTVPYRRNRFMAFLDPWKDPLGSGFQLVQSFISLGSGGIIGLGLGESKQKLSFLPASHTDFIFCLVGEELGLIGASVLIMLFVLLFVRGTSVVNKTNDKFVGYLAYGITLMISLQALINFAVVTGLVPTKGLPLPFLSYGGSALLVNMAAIGILLRISRGEDEREEAEADLVKARIRAKRRIYAARGRMR
jgi:cell division protein FtsW